MAPWDGAACDEAWDGAAWDGAAPPNGSGACGVPGRSWAPGGCSTGDDRSNSACSGEVAGPGPSCAPAASTRERPCS
ncbi:hypothetical protein [[Actinomadura] parvosata]|uniref:hypothetical protein n=1 Tax=[Actinomadura] parvosata TaxID=1955412 RepID=UPI001647677C